MAKRLPRLPVAGVGGEFPLISSSAEKWSNSFGQSFPESTVTRSLLAEPVLVIATEIFMARRVSWIFRREFSGKIIELTGKPWQYLFELTPSLSRTLSIPG